MIIFFYFCVRFGARGGVVKDKTPTVLPIHSFGPPTPPLPIFVCFHTCQMLSKCIFTAGKVKTLSAHKMCGMELIARQLTSSAPIQHTSIVGT